VRTVADARALALRTTAVDVDRGGRPSSSLFLATRRRPRSRCSSSVVLGVALRWSWRAAGLRSSRFVAAVGVRAYVRTEVLDARRAPGGAARALDRRGAPRRRARPEIQDQERRWQPPSFARERVAADLRATVTQTLSFAGIGRDQATHEEVLAAVRTIVDGETAGRDQLIERVATVLASPTTACHHVSRRSCCCWLAAHPDARIAAALFISPSTVRNHLQNMRAKLGLGSRAELAEFAARYAFST
jgi:DNA-binding CsgD family transcriptional regulator